VRLRNKACWVVDFTVGLVPPRESLCEVVIPIKALLNENSLVRKGLSLVPAIGRK